MSSVSDGFKFGLGLWLATMLLGTVWAAVLILIAVSIS